MPFSLRLLVVSLTRVQDQRYLRQLADAGAEVLSLDLRSRWDLALDVLRLPRIISVTTAANRRSWRVMEKIGMSVWRDDVPFEQRRRRVYALQRQ